MSKEWYCERCGKVDDTDGEPLASWVHMDPDPTGTQTAQMPSGKHVRICGGIFCCRTLSERDVGN